MVNFQEIIASGHVDLQTLPGNVANLGKNLRLAAGDPSALLAGAGGRPGSSVSSVIGRASRRKRRPRASPHRPLPSS